MFEKKNTLKERLLKRASDPVERKVIEEMTEQELKKSVNEIKSMFSMNEDGTLDFEGHTIHDIKNITEK